MLLPIYDAYYTYMHKVVYFVAGSMTEWVRSPAAMQETHVDAGIQLPARVPRE